MYKHALIVCGYTICSLTRVYIVLIYLVSDSSLVKRQASVICILNIKCKDACHPCIC